MGQDVLQAQVDQELPGRRGVPPTDRARRFVRRAAATARFARPRGRLQWSPIALTVLRKPWGEYGLNQAFQRTQARAGRSGWTFHSLRRFFVTELFRRGAPAVAIQQLAGHSRRRSSSGRRRQRSARRDRSDRWRGRRQRARAVPTEGDGSAIRAGNAGPYLSLRGWTGRLSR